MFLADSDYQLSAYHSLKVLCQRFTSLQAALVEFQVGAPHHLLGTSKCILRILRYIAIDHQTNAHTITIQLE